MSKQQEDKMLKSGFGLGIFASALSIGFPSLYMVLSYQSRLYRSKPAKVEAVNIDYDGDGINDLVVTSEKGTKYVVFGIPDDGCTVYSGIGEICREMVQTYETAEEKITRETRELADLYRSDIVEMDLEDRKEYLEMVEESARIKVESKYKQIDKRVNGD